MECEKKQNSVLLRQFSSTFGFQGGAKWHYIFKLIQITKDLSEGRSATHNGKTCKARPRNVMFFTEYVAVVWSWTLSTVRMQTTSNDPKAGCPRCQTQKKKVLNLIIQDRCLIWTAATSFEVGAWFQPQTIFLLTTKLWLVTTPIRPPIQSSLGSNDRKVEMTTPLNRRLRMRDLYIHAHIFKACYLRQVQFHLLAHSVWLDTYR
jgi:hypothetical protein